MREDDSGPPYHISISVFNYYSTLSTVRTVYSILYSTQLHVQYCILYSILYTSSLQVHKENNKPFFFLNVAAATVPSQMTSFSFSSTKDGKIRTRRKEWYLYKTHTHRHSPTSDIKYIYTVD